MSSRIMQYKSQQPEGLGQILWQVALEKAEIWEDSHSVA